MTTVIRAGTGEGTLAGTVPVGCGQPFLLGHRPPPNPHHPPSPPSSEWEEATSSPVCVHRALRIPLTSCFPAHPAHPRCPFSRSAHPRPRALSILPLLSSLCSHLPLLLHGAVNHAFFRWGGGRTCLCSGSVIPLCIRWDEYSPRKRCSLRAGDITCSAPS